MIRKEGTLMGRIPKSTIDEIKNASDIVDIVGRSVPLKAAGRNYLGLCPFHQEKTPSFTVSREKQIFHCFGCGEGGDVISFVMKQNQMSYPEAIRFLGDLAGIPIQESEEDQEAMKRRNRYFKINSTAGRYFFTALLSSAEAGAYLKRRGISMDLARRFGLGYAPDSWDGLIRAMEKEGVSQEELLELGLVSKSKKGKIFDRFRHRLMFPILNRGGKIIGFGGRALGDDPAKYLNSPENVLFHKGDNLYALNFLDRKEAQVILVEGYMDVISLYQQGLPCAVASLGTALTENQAKLLKRTGKNVYICYDSDRAGIAATERAIDVFRNIGVVPRIIRLGEGQDPDDYIKEFGEEAFRQLIKNALLPTEFSLSLAKEGLDFSKTEDKIKYINAARSTVSKIERKLIRDEYIKRIAKEMDLDEKSFGDEVEALRRRGGDRRVAPIKSKPRQEKPKQRADFETDLLRYSMEQRNYFERLESLLNEENILSEPGRELAKRIKTLYHQDSDRKSVKIEEIIEIYRTRTEMNEIIDEILKKSKRESGLSEKALVEITERLRREALENKKKRLLRDIQLLHEAGLEENEMKRLMTALLSEVRQLDLKLKV